ncbi:unnamed protein product, partial [Adineta steineri]
MIPETAFYEFLGKKLSGNSPVPPFHATAVHYAASVIISGIDVTSGHLNLDFGLGFYLKIHFRDTKDWCTYRFAPTCDGEAAILIFQLPQDVYHGRNIYQLEGV